VGGHLAIPTLICHSRHGYDKKVEHHREAPLSVAELLRLHQAKRLFNGRIAK
jgi:hypothetical protein